MADVYTRIGYIKGATGAQGERGLQGDPGDAATIQVGTVTTVPYGQTANVVNSGTESAAVFDFTIPQGRPGQETTDMQNLILGSITTSSASFPIPAVGETGKVLWGKVVKWFSDMAALVATKLNAANVVNNLTTTASGYALDARQGKTLHDQITSLNDSLTNLVTPVSLMSAQEGITITKNESFKIGNLIFVSIVFLSTNPSVVKDTALIWAPASWQANAPLNLYDSFGQMIQGNCRVNNHYIRPGSVIPANSEYSIQGMYAEES